MVEFIVLKMEKKKKEKLFFLSSKHPRHGNNNVGDNMDVLTTKEKKKKGPIPTIYQHNHLPKNCFYCLMLSWISFIAKLDGQKHGHRLYG